MRRLSWHKRAYILQLFLVSAPKYKVKRTITAVEIVMSLTDGAQKGPC